MLTTETKRRIDNCRDFLVGKLPLPTDQVELITLALIYKFMDDMDEQSAQLGGKRAFFTGLLETHRWRALMSKTLPAADRMARFASGLEALGDPVSGAHLPELFRDIFRNAFLKFRDGKTFALFAGEIDGFTYAHSEDLGNAFEYLLQSMATQGQNGQFRTPRHIIDFVIACLDPRPGERLLDPACGTGGFLVAAYKHILAKHSSPGAPGSGDLLKARDREKVYAGLSGYDITDFMVKLSKVNLFLHGFPAPDIHIYDTLSNDARWDEKFDLIAANPPFMTPKGGVTPHGRFRIPAKKAEVLFTDYIAEHLAPHGRAGIIVPNGIVATTQNAYVKLRKHLIEDDGLIAVVSLPAGIFRPYSGVKTSILFLDKKRARQTKEVLFLKIGADGFDLGDKRTPGGPDDLPEAQRVISTWRDNPNQPVKSHLLHQAVPKAELLAHKSCSLQAERFLGVTDESNSVERVTLGEIATFDYGHKAVAKETGEIRYIRITDIDEQGRLRPDNRKFITLDASANASLATRGDVFVARIGATAGKTLLYESDEPAVFASYLIRIRLDQAKVLPAFYWIFSKSDDYWTQREQLVSGGGQPQFNANALRLLEIPLPPLDEQRRIVAEIEGYQKVIDGARQVVAGYEISIPHDPSWEMILFEDLCERMQYGLSTPLVECGAGVRTFRMNELPRGRAADSGEMKCADIDAKERAKYRLESGDLLFNRTNSFEHVGRTGIFTLSGEYAFASYLIRLSVKRDLADPEYVNAFMNTKAFQTGVKSIASRAINQSNISASSLAGYEIPLPPLAEQRRIVSELDSEAAQIAAVRGLITTFERKIRRTLDKVWANANPS